MSSSKNSKSAANSSSSRKLTFFVPGDGIDREVISTDICRYLGNDATIRPGEYTDTTTGDTNRGYFITAYRALTTEQLADIKADSIRWNGDKKQPSANTSSNRQSSGGISPRAMEAASRRPEPVISDYCQSTTSKQQPQRVEVRPQEPYSVQGDRRLPIQDDRRISPSGGSNRVYESPPPQRIQQQMSNPYLGQAYSGEETVPRDVRAPPPYPPNTGQSRAQSIPYNAYPVAALPQPQYGYATIQPGPSAPIIPAAYPQQQLRNISPQYASASNREVDMYDVEEVDYRRQDMPPSIYRTSMSRQDLPPDYRAPVQREPDISSRRDERSDRQRDNRRRH